MNLDRKTGPTNPPRETGTERAELPPETLDAVAGGFRRNNLGLFTLNIGTVEN